MEMSIIMRRDFKLHFFGGEGGAEDELMQRSKGKGEEEKRGSEQITNIM